ncbi:MAG TPA: hypothetical protein VH062_33725 [Polyangiaceae bacterium]|nr:hypothetical protein [Polyangiaceae bacterium]
MSDTRRNHVVDAFTLLAAGGGALLVCNGAHVAPSAWSVAYVVLVLVVGRVVALGVHELGHLVAAAIGGWRWDVFKVGPLLLSRETGVCKVTLRGGRRFAAAGLVLTRPVSAATDTRGRHLLMLSGGPAASAVFAFAAATASRAVSAPLGQVALGVTAVFSAIVCVTTLLPFVSSGNPSDGASILALVRERTAARPGHAR